MCVRVIKTIQGPRSGFTELVLEEQTLSSDTKVPHQPLRYKIPNVVDHVDPLSPLASDEET